MQEILFIIAKTIYVILEIVSIAMLIRALMPIFFEVENSRLYALCFYISEPFVAPVRALMYRLNIGQNSPIDWSFMATYFIIWILQMFLPSI